MIDDSVADFITQMKYLWAPEPHKSPNFALEAPAAH
jgi:hypothetical protein